MITCSYLILCLRGKKRRRRHRINDCLIQNFSPLIRQAFGERNCWIAEFIYLPGTLQKQQLLSPSLLLSRIWGYVGAPTHPGKQVSSSGPPWSRLASACSSIIMWNKDTRKQPVVWHISCPSHPKYLLKMSHASKSPKYTNLEMLLAMNFNRVATPSSPAGPSLPLLQITVHILA